MFTGIVEGIGRVRQARPNGLMVEAGQVLEGVGLGDSMSVNGVCLTVTDVSNDAFSVDIMLETLRRSNLGGLKVGDRVNLERALTLDKGIGGHLVQGHIDDTGRVRRVAREGEASLVSIAAPPGVMRYLVEKGFVAVDGVSLTVVRCSGDEFSVSVVGYTKENTTLGHIKGGETVNIEVDILAKYVERLGSGSRGVTLDLLGEHGFLED